MLRNLVYTCKTANGVLCWLLSFRAWGLYRAFQQHKIYLTKQATFLYQQQDKAQYPIKKKISETDYGIKSTYMGFLIRHYDLNGLY